MSERLIYWYENHQNRPTSSVSSRVDLENKHQTYKVQTSYMNVPISAVRYSIKLT